MNRVHFVVAGEPQGKGRPRAFVMKGGPAAGQIRAYTPKKTRTYEGIVRSLAMDAMGQNHPMEGPLSMRLLIVCAIPQSWPAWKREAAIADRIRPTTKPDADNVLKGIADGIKGVVFNDDTQVVFMTTTKIYGETPRVEVEVTRIEAQAAQTAVKSYQPTGIQSAPPAVPAEGASL